MKIFIANDHAAVELKNNIVSFLKSSGFVVEDLGCNDNKKVDYPDYANALCERLLREIESKNIESKKEAKGILLCGSGIGMSIAANRHNHIRAALCTEPFSAQLAREHNDANVLCLGARLTGSDMAEQIIRSFLNAEFLHGRHEERVKKLN